MCTQADLPIIRRVPPGKVLISVTTWTGESADGSYEVNHRLERYNSVDTTASTGRNPGLVKVAVCYLSQEYFSGVV